MPPGSKAFQFVVPLSEIEGLLVKTVIFLPREIIGKLPGGRIRVEGTFNDAPFALAVQHRKNGARYFSVSAPLRKAAAVKVGNPVRVKFRIVNPDKLDIPEELEAVLAQDDAAREAWYKLTLGYRRGLIHYVTSVKNVDSRIRRSIDLLNRAKAGLLHGQRKKDERG
ncbi:MAG: YdeI/OmpD-associated family protein [Bacteroidota bacterium]|nr:YdeI/OmpD-associated family protein [Bacteroidota bacterium]